MTKPRDYCPFTRIAETETRGVGRFIANAVLGTSTYAELKQALRKVDGDCWGRTNYARFTEPTCEVFEIESGKWIPWPQLQTLASNFLKR